MHYLHTQCTSDCLFVQKALVRTLWQMVGSIRTKPNANDWGINSHCCPQKKYVKITNRIYKDWKHVEKCLLLFLRENVFLRCAPGCLAQEGVGETNSCSWLQRVTLEAGGKGKTVAAGPGIWRSDHRVTALQKNPRLQPESFRSGSWEAVCICNKGRHTSDPPKQGKRYFLEMRLLHDAKSAYDRVKGNGPRNSCMTTKGQVANGWCCHSARQEDSSGFCLGLIGTSSLQ